MDAVDPPLVLVTARRGWGLDMLDRRATCPRRTVSVRIATVPLVTSLLESELRDLLATRLEVLEPGLSLVRCEFSLRDAPLGTRGRIDILARDRHGLWVIIELKRERSSSRQALHEIAKYAELLQRDKQLAPDRIRALVVSTDWSELLVPVSNMARDWSHDLRGYELHVGVDGRLSADRVALLPESPERYITPVHGIYLYASPRERDRGWRQIRQIAAEVGATNLLAADFDRVGALNAVVAHYGLYLGIGTVEPADVDLEPAEDECSSDPCATGHPAEYRALCGINARVRCVDVESAYPGLLGNLLADPDWEVTGYRGTGAFAGTNGVHEERDWLRMLSGNDRGDGQVTFVGSANPRIATRWRSFVEQAMNSLGGNPEWETLVRAWLERVARQPGDVDVTLRVYNPCDLVQTIVHGWPDELDRWQPGVIATAEFADGTRSVVQGMLCADGYGAPGLLDMVHVVYRDPIKWMTTRYGGVTWEYDQGLLGLLGLRHVLLEIVGDGPEFPAPEDERGLWLVEDGQSMRVSSDDPEKFTAAWQSLCYNGNLMTLRGFLAAHRHEVDALRVEYLSCMDVRR
ncbi:endonuclease NucS domain-containing protein [Kitasatospora purpeofusca]|uniref:endonuclease NucS domain-containing protein n=1 Tax=Kitasatospora purpeofusca TaxID=67352 RepID=UPI003653BDD0